MSVLKKIVHTIYRRGVSTVNKTQIYKAIVQRINVKDNIQNIHVMLANPGTVNTALSLRVEKETSVYFQKEDKTRWSDLALTS